MLHLAGAGIGRKGRTARHICPVLCERRRTLRMAVIGFMGGAIGVLARSFCTRGLPTGRDRGACYGGAV